MSTARKWSNDGATETLTGTRALTAAEVRDYWGFKFDPGGAGRTVTLPDAADAGTVEICIVNDADAAEVITISADSATVATPTQAEMAVLYCSGVKWHGIAGANS